MHPIIWDHFIMNDTEPKLGYDRQFGYTTGRTDLYDEINQQYIS